MLSIFFYMYIYDLSIYRDSVDGRDATIDIFFRSFILLTSDQHHDNGEHLFGRRICRYISKTDGRKTGKGVVQCGHVRLNVCDI